MKRPLIVALAVGLQGREATGGLPPYTKALGDFLWQKAQTAAAGEKCAANEEYVCGAGNWGDGPQCNQWDQGYSPCWPSSLSASATWDLSLMELWSLEMAEEFGVTGRGQLGPGINLARFPWNGRLGEYMAGEDPYFGAKMVSTMVTAYRQVPHPPLQTAKHFVPNTIETNRNSIIEEVDERTLFEVYYPPFEAAVNAGVSGVMCSYNLVKCTSGKCAGMAAYACANDDILNKHLKDTMGFRGIVISDWDATKCQDAAASSPGCSQGGYVDNNFAAEAGLDLEMPSCMSFKGGVQKRAAEKAARMQWAYLMQGRSPGRRLQEVRPGNATDGPAAAVRRLQAGAVSSLQWANYPNKCFQVDGDSPVNGMRVQLWDCLDSPKQQFVWSAADSKIHWAAHPKMCMDVAGHDFTNGAPIQLWSCLENDDDQLFQLSADGKGKIVSKGHPSMCLDVTGHKTFNGNRIQLWECLSDDDDQVLTAGHVAEPVQLPADWAADQPAGSDAALPTAEPLSPAPSPSPSWSTGVYKTNPFDHSAAPRPAPKPSWNTGVYKTNPFGASKAAGTPVAAGPAPAPGSLPRKQDAPTKGKRCPDQAGKNYKNLCKLALADRIIAEGTAILKNEGGVLPLKKGAAVALIGKQACAKDPIAQGGGSGWNGFACNKVPKITVQQGIAGLEGGPKLTCPDASGDNAEAAGADVVLAAISPAKASEGTDRSSLQLDADDVALIKKYADMGKKVVVATNAPGPLITSTWDAKVAAIAVSWLPGQQNGRGIAMALYNEDYAASGRLPFTFPRCATESCTQDEERASVALGDKIANGAYIKYDDKALIGYRWYQAQGLRVSYPFGFGLFAYGSAEVDYSNVLAKATGKSVKVSALLTQTGPQDGMDVPQLYLSFPSSVPGDPAIKPKWVLKGFEKVLVKPNVPTSVTFTLTERDLSYWDDAPGRSLWVCATGQFTVCVGANSRDAVLHDTACAQFASPCGGGGAADSQAPAPAGPVPAASSAPAASQSPDDVMAQLAQSVSEAEVEAEAAPRAVTPATHLPMVAAAGACAAFVAAMAIGAPAAARRALRRPARRMAAGEDQEERAGVYAEVPLRHADAAAA